MRSLMSALFLILILNVVATVGFVGWMAMTNRINADRVKQTIEMYKLTLAEEQKLDEQAKALAEQTAKAAEEAARLERISERGPTTVNERLELQQQQSELAVQRAARIQREIEDLRRQLEVQQRVIDRQSAELKAERERFEQVRQEEQQKQLDENFQQAVQLIQGMPPKLAKEHFQKLLADRKLDEAVSYLAAMQQRKAVKVLSEFKTEDEVQQSSLLIARLRERGVIMGDDETATQ